MLIFTSCNKGPDYIKDCVNPQLGMIYTLLPVDSGDVVELRFIDPDGEGGEEPIITTSDLMANTIYTGGISILNESEIPAEDWTSEILEEGADHQFFYISSGADLTFEYTDADDNGNPIGILTTLTTGEAGSGNLMIVLQYHLNKNADGVTSGDISNAGGETDIEVVFPITIQ